ncbi:hypothetical protein [Bdellovibrio sp. ArHS]|uniref:hypothetical protein n=1 Tax=Bdellovibrio sp. ArHS TaxID=1569284 RepID=UPI000AE8B976|nr:hypothetical protein [Bdellovibrio sp. ArHS]
MKHFRLFFIAATFLLSFNQWASAGTRIHCEGGVNFGDLISVDIEFNDEGFTNLRAAQSIRRSSEKLIEPITSIRYLGSTGEGEPFTRGERADSVMVESENLTYMLNLKQDSKRQGSKVIVVRAATADLRRVLKGATNFYCWTGHSSPQENDPTPDVINALFKKTLGM